MRTRRSIAIYKKKIKIEEREIRKQKKNSQIEKLKKENDDGQTEGNDEKECKYKKKNEDNLF